MRPTLLLVLCLIYAPAYAIEARDTMAAWRRASGDEKRKLVASLLQADRVAASPARIIECLDAAASVPGHSELTIGQVEKACEGDGGQPV